MSNIKLIFNFLILLSRILIGIYFFYLLIMNLRNPMEYPLEKLNWFLFFFVWELWTYNAMTKPTDDNETDNKEVE